MGAGPIGLAIIQCLKARKPGQVIVAEVSVNRARFAQRFGATAVIDPLREDVVSKCKLLCDGQGPDIAFECAGVAASIKSACLSVRSRGTIGSCMLAATRSALRYMLSNDLLTRSK